MGIKQQIQISLHNIFKNLNVKYNLFGSFFSADEESKSFETNCYSKYTYFLDIEVNTCKNEKQILKSSVLHFLCCAIYTLARKMQANHVLVVFLSLNFLCQNYSNSNQNELK